MKPESQHLLAIAEIATPSSLRAKAGCAYPVYAVTKHNGMMPSADFFNKRVHSRDIEGYRVVRRGQFAYATIHLDEGAIAVLDSADYALISPMYTVFEVDETRVHAPYFIRKLKSSWALNQYATLGNGSVHRRRSIPFEALGRLKVTLPSLVEQRRTALLLDKADALRQKRQKAIHLAAEFLRAVFLEMFGDPATNPKGWKVQRLSEIGTLDRGVSKHRPRNDPTLLGGDHPLIQTGEVANCDGYIRAYTSTYSDKGLRQSKLWPAGTLCITIAANIAKTGILRFDACFPDSVVGFTASEVSIIEYVRFWLSFLQKTLEANAPESAQKNINLAILRDLQIPMPPISLIRRFAAVVAATESVRASHAKSMHEMDVLGRSLQHRLLA